MRMRRSRCQWIVGIGAAFALVGSVQTRAAQDPPITPESFGPRIGQPGKDVVWVPTPLVTVEKMLDMAEVTAEDYVMDLGSGDGRNIIAAAKRGARALGVEYNPDMVELSRRNAAEAGVADEVTFVEGDMYEADISEATVLALFLLPTNLRQLTPKFLDLRPGTRIVANTFGIDGWTPDEQDDAVGGCDSWCRTLLWIVPAEVEGTWHFSDAELTLAQAFQMVSGTLSAGEETTPIARGRLRGADITFAIGSTEYSGRVTGDTMEGVARTADGERAWTATRVRE